MPDFPEKYKRLICDFREIVPSAEYPAGVALAAGVEEEVARVAVSGGRAYYQGYRILHRSTNLNQDAKNLESYVQFEGGSWIPFLNAAGARDVHILDAYRGKAAGTADDWRALDNRIPQRCTINIPQGAAQYRILAVEHIAPEGFTWQKFANMAFKVKNQEGALSITVTGLFIWFVYEEGAVVTVTTNP